MSWMLTATGAEYHLPADAPAALRPIRVADIAHQLAQINRFHGACVRPYSVAEHSLLVCEIAERNGCRPTVQLAALLHDAHEIYTQDVSSPAKMAIDSLGDQPYGAQAWHMFETAHARHLRGHFGLQVAFHGARNALHRFDLHALATERAQLTAYVPGVHQPWQVLQDTSRDPVLPLDWVNLRAPERAAMAWTDWRDRFQDRFDELQHAIDVRGEDLGVAQVREVSA